MKKRASKVAHNQPRPFYFTVQPRQQPIAQNRVFILWNLGTRHLFSYLWITYFETKTSKNSGFIVLEYYLLCPKVLHWAASVLACRLWLVLENWGDFHVKSCWLACILSCFHFLAATFADDSARKQLDQSLYEVAFTFFNSSTIKGQLNSQCKPKIIRITKQS